MFSHPFLFCITCLVSNEKPYIVTYVHKEFEYEQMHVQVYNATNINEVSTSKVS